MSFPNRKLTCSWLYRIIPSAAHSAMTAVSTPWSLKNGLEEFQFIPNQTRWSPFDLNKDKTFVEGLKLVGGAGDPRLKHGLGIFIYSAGKNMYKEAFYSSDGDFLIVPQHGDLDIKTELGNLYVRPQEIAVIPRGIRFKVSFPNGPARGYIMELYSNHFELPELGPIGSNCLANARDFEAPVAAFEEDETQHFIYSKFAGSLFRATQNHSPFDVVAWHGLYYPYKYDLGKFSPVGSVSFDHPDPSIFTVLTAQSERPGTAIADFVIFPPRWLVQENTFRPPWYHRNTMSEFMGLIAGDYDAKEGGGFEPGGASLHNVMSSHGPDYITYEKASTMALKPQKVGANSIAFMFESSLMLGLTEWGLKTCEKVQETYTEDSWVPIKKHFKRPN
jgi:homogentisate 1,2-dioxygenase